jgi:hypothetical protein
MTVATQAIDFRMPENDPGNGVMVSEHGSAISKRYQICCALPAVRASHLPSTRSRCKSQEDSAMEISVVTSSDPPPT